MSYTTSTTGINLIKSFEGCPTVNGVITAYQDVVGVWTIGWGHTGYISCKGKNVCSGMTLTLAQATQLLKSDLTKYEKLVNKYNTKYNWTQNELDALVSFALNIGSIDGLTANGTRTREIIANKILEYNKAGGKTISGLVARRKKEQALFLSGATTTTTTTTVSSVSSSELKQTIKNVQNWLNDYIDAGLTVDGSLGALTKKAINKAIQTALNELGANLKIDGVIGSLTKAKLPTLKLGSNGNIVQCLEASLYVQGYQPHQFSGKYDANVASAVGELQSNNSLSTDKVCGKNTWTKIYF